MNVDGSRIHASHRPLDGRLAIITDVSTGDGVAIASNLASKGYSILGMYVDDSLRYAVENHFFSLSQQHAVCTLAIQVDFLQPELAARSMIKAARAHFTQSNGNLVVHVLVNCAGISGDPRRLEDISVSDFYRIYTVNVLGPLVMTRSVIPYLPFDRSGRIINISSRASRGEVRGQTLYDGTKAALDAMTQRWSKELADRATVNGIDPVSVVGVVSPNSEEEAWGGFEPTQLRTPPSDGQEGLDRRKRLRLSEGQKKGSWSIKETQVSGIVGMLCGEDSAWCTGSIICANESFQ